MKRGCLRESRKLWLLVKERKEFVRVREDYFFSVRSLVNHVTIKVDPPAILTGMIVLHFKDL